MKTNYPYIYITYSKLDNDLSLRQKAKLNSVHYKKLMKHCTDNNITHGLQKENGNIRWLKLYVPDKAIYDKLYKTLKAKQALV